MFERIVKRALELRATPAPSQPARATKTKTAAKTRAKKTAAKTSAASRGKKR